MHQNMLDVITFKDVFLYLFSRWMDFLVFNSFQSIIVDNKNNGRHNYVFVVVVKEGFFFFRRFMTYFFLSTWTNFRGVNKVK